MHYSLTLVTTWNQEMLAYLKMQPKFKARVQKKGNWYGLLPNHSGPYALPPFLVRTLSEVDKTQYWKRQSGNQFRRFSCDPTHAFYRNHIPTRYGRGLGSNSVTLIKLPYSVRGRAIPPKDMHLQCWRKRVYRTDILNKFKYNYFHMFPASQ